MKKLIHLLSFNLFVLMILTGCNGTSSLGIQEGDGDSPSNDSNSGGNSGGGFVNLGGGFGNLGGGLGRPGGGFGNLGGGLGRLGGGFGNLGGGLGRPGGGFSRPAPSLGQLGFFGNPGGNVGNNRQVSNDNASGGDGGNNTQVSPESRTRENKEHRIEDIKKTIKNKKAEYRALRRLVEIEDTDEHALPVMFEKQKELKKELTLLREERETLRNESSSNCKANDDLSDEEKQFYSNEGLEQIRDTVGWLGKTAINVLQTRNRARLGKNKANLQIKRGERRKARDRKREKETIHLGKTKVQKETFHKTTKESILKQSGDFSGKVGRNPDIQIVKGKIRLKGQGPFSGKSLDTGLDASDFFGEH